MAYRRTITDRVKLFYQQRNRVTPLFSHTHRHDSDGEGFPAKSVSSNFGIRSCIQNRFLGTKSNLSNFQRSGNFVGYELVFGRSFSSPSVGEGVADGVEFYSDEVEAAVAAKVTPVVSEVAAVAADSADPVAVVQYMIDYVHCVTGFNWWASIAIATVLIRCLQIPFYLWEMKIISKVIPVKKEFMALGKTGDTEKEIRTLNEKYAVVNGVDSSRTDIHLVVNDAALPGLTLITLSGISYSIFFNALNSMADNIPSFKEGGILWFTDLTTPDSMLGFPMLMALTLLYDLKRIGKGFKEGNYTPIKTLELQNAYFTLLSIPFLVFFPKAIFCHWITSRLFFLAFVFVTRKLGVEKVLELPTAAPSTDKKSKV